MNRAILLPIIILLVFLPVALVVGCQQQPESTPATPTPTPTLSIHNIQLCSAISDDGDYTVQPGAIFERGAVVWLYFEIPGITVKGVNSKFEWWGKFKVLKIYDPNGDIIASVMNLGEIRETDLDEIPDFIWFYARYETTADHLPGQYTFDVTVSDELSGAIGTASANFTLK